MFEIHCETAADAAPIDALHDLAFGPGRHARSGFLLRGEAPFASALSFTAHEAGRLIGSIRFAEMTITSDEESRPALLLGPLAVIPERQGNGLGIALVTSGLEAARAQGHDLVLLIGDPRYYAKAGFQKVPMGDIRASIPIDRQRLCWLSLSGEIADSPRGLLRMQT